MLCDARDKHHVLVPNWRRIIVGDAFKLPSRNLNYYRDLALVWPTILLLVLVLDRFGRSQTREALFFSALLVGALLAAKEKVFLLIGVVGTLGAQGLIKFLLLGDWPFAALAAACLAVVVGIIRARPDYTPSYGWPKETTVIEVSFVGLSLILFLELLIPLT